MNDQTFDDNIINTQLSFTEQDNQLQKGDWDEATWLRAVAQNSVFDFLHDPKEDIYTVADGKPFQDNALE